MLTQKKLLEDKAQFKFMKTKDGGYYLIPISYLENIDYNKGN